MSITGPGTADGFFSGGSEAIFTGAGQRQRHCIVQSAEHAVLIADFQNQAARAVLCEEICGVTIVKKSCLKLFTIVVSGSMMSTLAE